jgi:hypothetical protein
MFKAVMTYDTRGLWLAKSLTEQRRRDFPE